MIRRDAISLVRIVAAAVVIALAVAPPWLGAARAEAPAASQPSPAQPSAPSRTTLASTPLTCPPDPYRLLTTVLAAMGPLAGACIAGFVALRTTRLTQEHQRAADAARQVLEHRSEADALLQQKRSTAYERLVKLSQNFPKYPAARRLTPADVLALSEELQSCYFESGGLYLTEPSKWSYFDLMDGLRVVLAKTRLIEFALPPPDADRETIRTAFEREPKWEAPTEIRELLRQPVVSGEWLDDPVVTALRKLASALRTQLTEELLSRRELLLAAAPPRSASA